MLGNAQSLATDVYMDIGALEAMRARARIAPGENLREVAQQFEALFVQMMLASMREASLGEGAFDSHSSRMYRDMHDKQLGLDLSASGGLGLADILMRQLGGTSANAETPSPPGIANAAPTDPGLERRPAAAMPLAGTNPAEPLPPPARPGSGPAEHAAAAVAAAAGSTRRAEGIAQSTEAVVAHGGTAPLAVASPGTTDADDDLAGQLIGQLGARRDAPAPAPPGGSRAALFATPGEFIDALWEHAEAAARKLGAPPEALLAQAALESGWGRHVARDADGRSSHNLFGIKADRRWSGEALTTPTVEFLGGQRVERNDAFRVYPDYAQSFADYVDFLHDNPRYTDALRETASPERYFAALQRAGYATDPRYARKLIGVLEGDTMRAALRARGAGGSGG